MKLPEIFKILEGYPGHDYEAIARLVSDRPKRPRTAWGNVIRFSSDSRPGFHQQEIAYTEFALQFDRYHDNGVNNLTAMSGIEIPVLYHPIKTDRLEAVQIPTAQQISHWPHISRLIREIGDEIAGRDSLYFEEITNERVKRLLESRGNVANHMFRESLGVAGMNEKDIRELISQVTGSRDTLKLVIDEEVRLIEAEYDSRAERLREYAKRLRNPAVTTAH